MGDLRAIAQALRLVPDVARRLAAALGLPFVPVVRKMRPTKLQKRMQNSFQQAHNLADAFEVDPLLYF